MVFDQELSYPFKTKPYDHQRVALEKSWNKDDYALFMEMGTGKSKVLIDNISILYDRGYLNAAVIIAPKGVYRNWEMIELPAHLPDHIIHKTVVWNPTATKRQQELLDSLFILPDEELNILIVNVEAFSTQKGSAFVQKFLKTHTALMAVDESTTIKNPKAKRTKNIIKLSRLAKYRRILTGSPVTKSPLDLYSQCEFLDEVYLGYSSYYSFQSRYAIIQKRSVATHSFQQVLGYQNLDELNDVLKSFS
jgi:SNF2 family DNA or RNA helicase